MIPNFIDTDWIRPAPTDNGYRREFGLEGKTVVMYAGNVGFSQSLDLLLAAATTSGAEPWADSMIGRPCGTSAMSSTMRQKA